MVPNNQIPVSQTAEQVANRSAPELTAVILTLNEEAHIGECIQSLAWTDRVIVFDSYSQDQTVALAEAAGATVLQSKFENYAQQRNAALAALETDWVFFVDADERGTPELASEIRRVIGERPEMGWYSSTAQFHFWHIDLRCRMVPGLPT